MGWETTVCKNTAGVTKNWNNFDGQQYHVFQVAVSYCHVATVRFLAVKEIAS